MIEEITKFRKELEGQSYVGANLNQDEAQQPNQSSINQADQIKNFVPGSIIIRQTQSKQRHTMSEEGESLKIFFVKYPIYTGKEVLGDDSDIQT